MFHPLERLLPGAQPSLELSRLDRFEDLAEFGTGLKTEGDQIVSSHEWRRNDRFVSELLAFPLEEFVVIEHSMAALAINPVQLELLVKGRPGHETVQSSHSHQIG